MQPKQSSPSVSTLRTLLLSERQKAEAELQKLGRSKRAWRAIKVLSPQEESDFHPRYWRALATWHNYTERHRRAFRTWLDAQPVRPAEDSLDALWAEWWLKHARRRIPRILEYRSIPSGWLGGEEFEKLFRNRESQPCQSESAPVTPERRTGRTARARTGSATLHVAWLKVHGPTVDQLLGPRTRVTKPARARKLSRNPTHNEHLLEITVTETTQEWRNAERAALADAALRKLDDRVSIFAAGVSLGQSYLAEVHARQSRPSLTERAVLDAHSEAGRLRHAGEADIHRVHAIIRTRAKKLLTNHGPYTTALKIHRDPEIQDKAREVNDNRPYSLSNIKKIVAMVR